MICDAWTIMRKDLREMTSLHAQGLGALVGALSILLIFGVILPWQFGGAWSSHPIFLLLWIWLPWPLAAGVAADAFAGERERHTLDALYATRLSDAAIFLGKMGAVAAYAWALTLLTLALSAGTLALLGAPSALPLLALLHVGGLSLLVATVAATLGALCSLRARGAAQAQQTMLAATAALAVLLLASGRLLALFIPRLQARLVQSMAAGETGNTASTLLALALLTLELLLLALAAKSVRRARLNAG